MFIMNGVTCSQAQVETVVLVVPHHLWGEQLNSLYGLRLLPLMS